MCSFQANCANLVVCICVLYCLPAAMPVAFFPKLSRFSLTRDMLQDFGHNASSPLAINLPAASSGQQVVAFAIGVTDRSEVDLTCQLSGTGETSPLSYAPGFALNTEYACTSPQVFSITSAGSYNFSVTGTDAVGNFQQDPVSHAFNVSYADGEIFTVLDTPSWGLTNSSSHEFILKAITGTPNGQGMTVATSQQFQVSVANLSSTLPGVPLQWVPAPWADINGSTYSFQVGSVPAAHLHSAFSCFGQKSSTSQCRHICVCCVDIPGHRIEFALWYSWTHHIAVCVQAPTDGEYQLRVRTQSGTLKRPVSTWRLTVDSTPPNVTFLAAPPAVMLSDVAVMRVTADEEDVRWQCALLDGDFSHVRPELLKPSCNMSSDGTIEYGGLQDGSQFTSAVRRRQGRQRIPHPHPPVPGGSVRT